MPCVQRSLPGDLKTFYIGDKQEPTAPVPTWSSFHPVPQLEPQSPRSCMAYMTVHIQASLQRQSNSSLVRKSSLVRAVVLPTHIGWTWPWWSCLQFEPSWVWEELPRWQNWVAGSAASPLPAYLYPIRCSHKAVPELRFYRSSVLIWMTKEVKNTMFQKSWGLGRREFKGSPVTFEIFCVCLPRRSGPQDDIEIFLKKSSFILFLSVGEKGSYFSHPFFRDQGFALTALWTLFVLSPFNHYSLISFQH